MAVQFSNGDPTQLDLAGTDTAADIGTREGLLSIGLVIAALLAAAAAVAVWLDSRRTNRQRPDAGVATHAEPERQAAAGSAVADPAAGTDIAVDAGQVHSESLTELSFGQADWSAEAPAAIGTMRTGQGSSSVDLVFPFASSLADSLHDELFTHRTVYS